MFESSLEIPLPNGGTLFCEEGGEEVRILDKDRNEVVMWSYTEWEEDPQVVMSAIFSWALTPTDEALEILMRTKVEGNCWI
jgi:hypothetical protein